jgi:hypothetical protein
MWFTLGIVSNRTLETFYAFSMGCFIVIDCLLLRGDFFRKYSTRIIKILHLAYTVLQLTVLVIDVICDTALKNYIEPNYVFYMYAMLAIAVHVTRYRNLKIMERTLSILPEGEKSNE